MKYLVEQWRTNWRYRIAEFRRFIKKELRTFFSYRSTIKWYMNQTRNLHEELEACKNMVNLMYYSSNAPHESKVKYCVSCNTGDKLERSEKGSWREHPIGSNPVIHSDDFGGYQVWVKNKGLRPEDLVMWIEVTDTTNSSKLGSKYFKVVKGEIVSYQKNCPKK